MWCTMSHILSGLLLIPQYMHTYIHIYSTYTVIFWASPVEAAVRLHICHVRILPVAEFFGREYY